MGQKRMLLGLLDRLAPHYGDDWWFTAHHGMALSENGQHDAARPKIERSLAQNPANPWAAHATAHLAYEQGEPSAACAFLAAWLTTYPRNGPLYSHLSWHLALAHLEAGDSAAASRLFRDAFAGGMPPWTAAQQKLGTDAVIVPMPLGTRGAPANSRAGAGRANCFSTKAVPRAGALILRPPRRAGCILAGDDSALAVRAGQIEALVREGRYPSGSCVPAASRGFAAFERGDVATAIDALEPIADELERIGGSHAQLDLVRFTLLKAYLGADRPDDAHRLLHVRRPHASAIPIAGLELCTDRRNGSAGEVRNDVWETNT